MSFKKKSTNPFRNKRKSTWKTGEKFDPEASSDEEVTPWIKIQQQMLDKKNSAGKAGTSQLPNDVLKKRNEEHMKYLITEKPKEKTTWEKFSDDEQDKNRKQYPNPKKNFVHKTKEGKVSKKPSLKERLEKDKNAELTTADRNFVKKLITLKTMEAKNNKFGKLLEDLQHRGVKRFMKKK